MKITGATQYKNNNEYIQKNGKMNVWWMVQPGVMSTALIDTWRPTESFSWWAHYNQEPTTPTTSTWVPGGRGLGFTSYTGLIIHSKTY